MLLDSDRFRVAFNEACDFLAIVAADGKLSHLNNQAQRLLEQAPPWTQIDLAEASWWANPPGDRRQIRSALSEAAEGRLSRCQLEVRAPVGLRRFCFSFKPLPEPDDSGQAQVLVEGRDITEQHALQTELLQTQQELQRMVRQRDEALERARQQIELEMRLLRDAVDRNATYAAIVEHSSDGIIAHTLDGTVVIWNRAAEAIFGYSESEMRGGSLMRVVPEDRRQEVLRANRDVRRGQVFRDHETERVRKDGSLIQVSITTSPIKDSSGAVVGVSRIIRDITQRKRMEEALHQSEERFSKAFGASPDGLVISSRIDGQIYEVNASFLELFQLTREQTIGRRTTELRLFDDPADGDRALEALQRDGRLRDYEMVLRRQTGERRTALLSAEPIVLSGQPLIVTIVRDITAQRDAEAALRESEARARAILDTAVDGIITISDKGLIESVNPAVERLFGYSQEQLLGRNINLLMPSPFHEHHDEYLRRFLTTGSAKVIGVGRELVGRRRDGTVFPLQLAVSAVSFGERRLFTGIMHDLTQRKRMEQEILQAADREQQRIGQDLHDGLGQLLAGIGFMSKALEGRLAATGAADPADARTIAQLVTQAIEQSRGMARGLQPVKRGPMGLLLALQELARSVEGIYGISCSVEAPDDIEMSDGAVATQMYRIAQEAVSNAVRHGKASHIVVGLERQGGTLVLTVTDDGVGLPEIFPGSRGQGLQIMNHRASVIGAILSIGRRGDIRGTIVTCTLVQQGWGRLEGVS